MNAHIEKRLGPIQAALVLGLAFVVLGWLYVLLIGVREPLLPRR